MSTTTFSQNTKLPIHSWFRYSAGFSANWVEEVVKKESGDSSAFHVLDPFAGSGTTLLACDTVNILSSGFESQPLVNRIANAKLLWSQSIETFQAFSAEVLNRAKCENTVLYDYPDLIYKCYDSANLSQIDRLRKTLESLSNGTPQSELAWLAFVCILRPTSHAGTATWQYVLPSKQKAKVLDVFDAFAFQVKKMSDDISIFQSSSAKPLAKLYKHDARCSFEKFSNSVDLVVTSPPYANNYDYADATRLELSVLGEIRGWGDLQTKIRPELIRSCSQMVSKERAKTFEYLEDPILEPIRDEIISVCRQLDEEKNNHGGKKNYHTMIALYFLDLANTFHSLRGMCRDGSKMCFVIGDSAPYGVYVPVEQWLGRLAVGAGFDSYSFEKLRDRNIKWKNRKHRVPLKEGHLWIRG